MRWATTAAAAGPSDLTALREWFVDFVRADGPLPTLRVGRHPYGLLPVAAFERARAARVSSTSRTSSSALRATG